MRGVQFLVDDEGRKTAVLIDLKKNARLWEDFYDVAVAKSRAGEPRESLAKDCSREGTPQMGQARRVKTNESTYEAG